MMRQYGAFICVFALLWNMSTFVENDSLVIVAANPLGFLIDECTFPSSSYPNQKKKPLHHCANVGNFASERIIMLDLNFDGLNNTLCCIYAIALRYCVCIMP
jgi:hypothetical protein